MEEKLKGFAAHPENINRKGRPRKGNTMADIASSIGDTEIDGKTRKERLMAKIWEIVEEDPTNNARLVKIVWDHIDGMPTQKNENFNINMPEIIEQIEVEEIESTDSPKNTETTQEQ